MSSNGAVQRLRNTKTCNRATGFQLLLATLAASLLLSCADEQPEGFAFKIAVVEDGMVRVAFDDLGYRGAPPSSSQLTLTERGQPVVIEVEDGVDGRFGPGDNLTFLGRHLQGEHSWFDPWSDENIYVLRARDDESGSAPDHSPVASGDAHAPDRPGQRRSIEAEPIETGEDTFTRHYEHEEIRIALPGAMKESRETWYWNRINHLHREPFVLPLSDGSPPVAIRVALAALPGLRRC